MKLNIFVTEPDDRFDQNIPLGGLGNIDTFVEDAECTEIQLESSDFLPMINIVEVLGKLATKLRHGGVISVTCTDLLDMGRVITERTYSTEELNAAIYGEYHNPKRSALPLNELVNLLKSFDLKIIKKRMQHSNNYVEAIRE